MSTNAVTISRLGKSFGAKVALQSLDATIRTGEVTGLVGPDGAGKTTLIRLMAGLMLPSEGEIRVFNRDTERDAEAIQELISYMPQRFGLYEDLTVMENLVLYANLRGVTGKARAEAFERLLTFTDLKRFTGRIAGALSGGMKQKLGLACALIKKPALLLLDEPSVGVDPISRRELWQLVRELVDDSMAVIWSTAYLDEAERCDTVLLLSEGKLLFSGPPDELTNRMRGRTFQIRDIQSNRRQVLKQVLSQPGVIDGVIQGRDVRLVTAPDQAPPALTTLNGSLTGSPDANLVAVTPRFEDAFIDALGGGPGGHSQLADHMPVIQSASDGESTGPKVQKNQKVMIEAQHLTKRYGDFTAANDISFQIRAGEIFGLLGPNGAGKSTTFKMMCGLLTPTQGTARVVGLNLQDAPSQARSRIGYMAQKFSLYGNLSVLSNLKFFAGAYGLSRREKQAAIDGMIDTFALTPYLNMLAGQLPLGFKQRLALACAVMHNPAVLFLDEPTSGVDPVTRREFWTHINGMVEKGVTIMVTTHFMDEAEYCDRLALVYRGQIIAKGEPDHLKDNARSSAMPEPTLEDAFIALIEAFDANRQEAAA